MIDKPTPDVPVEPASVPEQVDDHVPKIGADGVGDDDSFRGDFTGDAIIESIPRGLPFEAFEIKRLEDRDQPAPGGQE